jgi:hypothetical protein
MRQLITLVALLVLAMASLGPSSVLASKSPPPPSGTVDQQYTATTDNALGVSSGQSVAQTYTAGMSGSLVAVHLALSVGSSKPTAGLQVSIYDASNGLPTGTALYTSASLKPHVASFPSDTWVTVTLPAGVVPQVPNSEYAIVLTSTSAGNKPWNWNGAAAAGYAGGQPDTEFPAGGTWAPYAGGYMTTSDDLDFQTYVG